MIILIIHEIPKQPKHRITTRQRNHIHQVRVLHMAKTWRQPPVDRSEHQPLWHPPPTSRSERSRDRRFSRLPGHRQTKEAEVRILPLVRDRPREVMPHKPAAVERMKIPLNPGRYTYGNLSKAGRAADTPTPIKRAERIGSETPRLQPQRWPSPDGEDPRPRMGLSGRSVRVNQDRNRPRRPFRADQPPRL